MYEVLLIEFWCSYHFVNNCQESGCTAEMACLGGSCVMRGQKHSFSIHRAGALISLLLLVLVNTSSGFIPGRLPATNAARR